MDILTRVIQRQRCGSGSCRLWAAGVPRGLQHDHGPRPLGAAAEGQVSHYTHLTEDKSADPEFAGSNPSEDELKC